MSTENKLGTMPVNKLIWNVSLPLMASMIVQALYNIVDSFFVSMVNQDSLTAVSLAFSAQFLMVAFASGTGVGINALLSRFLGAREYEKVDSVAAHGEFLAICMGIIFAILGRFLVHPYFLAQTKVASIVQAGENYLHVITLCSITIFVQVLNERLLQSTGRSKYSMYSQMIGAVTNMILDPFFILSEIKIGSFVVGGLGLGTKGAAIATVIGQFFGSLLGVYFNMTVNADIHLTFKHFKPNFKLIREIYGIALPSILMLAVGSVLTFFMNKIIITYHAAKETAATAYGIYFKLNSFVTMPVVGLNNGIVPIVAYNYGAQRKDRIQKAIKLGVLYSISLQLVGLTIFELFARELIGIFHPTQELLAVGVPCLRIIALCYIFAGACISLSSIMQALGKATYSMIISMLRQLVLLLPIAWILAVLGQKFNNSNFIWWSYSIAEFFALLLSIFFYQRLFKTIITPLPEIAQKNAKNI